MGREVKAGNVEAGHAAELSADLIIGKSGRVTGTKMSSEKLPGAANTWIERGLERVRFPRPNKGEADLSVVYRIEAPDSDGE